MTIGKYINIHNKIMVIKLSANVARKIINGIEVANRIKEVEERGVMHIGGVWQEKDDEEEEEEEKMRSDSDTRTS